MVPGKVSRRIMVVDYGMGTDTTAMVVLLVDTGGYISMGCTCPVQSILDTSGPDMNFPPKVHEIDPEPSHRKKSWRQQQKELPKFLR